MKSIFVMREIAGRGEAAKTAELAAAVWSEHYTPLIGAEQVAYMLGRFQSADAIYDGMQTGTRYFWMCENGEPVGYFAVKPEEDRLFLSKLYLLAAARGKGYARRALERINRLAHASGAASIYLTVNKRNPSAEVYKSLGFTVRESVEMDIGGGYVMDDYIMERPVAEPAGTSAAAIVVAAGGSTRMGGVDKQAALLAGRPVLARTLGVFERAAHIEETVVVTREEDVDVVRALCAEYGLWKVTAVVPGGATRQQSVARGMRETLCDFVAVHDGARPLIRPGTIDGVVEAAWKHGAAAAAVRAKDTMKLADGDGFIRETPDRSRLWHVQTPQVFPRAVFLRILAFAAEKGRDFTDDCQLMEMTGERVFLYEAEYDNVKITTPEDLILAEEMLKARGETV